MTRFVQLCLAIALCASLAACGSSGSAANKSSTTAAGAGGTGAAGSGALTQARVAAAKCMRTQGIDIPDPSPGTGAVRSALLALAGYPQAKVQAAEKACSAEILKAFPNLASLTPAETSKRIQEASAFATCMRSHGIDFPDPTSFASNPSAYLRAVSAIDLSSPAVKAAGTTCRAVVLKDLGGG